MSDFINHISNLSLALENLFVYRNDPEVTLVVKDKEIPVHRVILGAQSYFFHTLFYDNQFLEGDKDRMTIDAPLKAFETVLLYMYSGKMDMEPNGLDEKLEILELSRRFGLIKLEESLVEHLVAIANYENVSDLISAAEIFDSENLMEKCCRILSKHGKKFFNSESFLYLNDLEFASICTHESLKILEIDKFEGIARWFKANSKCPEETRQRILDSVDLYKFTNDQLLTIVGPTRLYDDYKLLEITQIQKREIPLQEFKWKVVVGKNPDNILSETEFVSAVQYNGRKELVIDFGEFITFNYLEFNLKDFCRNVTVSSSSVQEFPASGTDPNGLQWQEIKYHGGCQRLQHIYVPETTTKLLRIQAAEYLNSFKVKRVSKVPELVDGYICSRENIFTTETALIEFGTSQAALSWELVERGMQTPYTESRNGWITILLNQPYFLRKCRFRLWDFDGHRQTFTFLVYNSKQDLTFEKEFSAVMGWQTVVLPPGAYRTFDFVGKASSTIRLVHLEASG